MNIQNILKDKPKGTKLYSPICGECELLSIDSMNNIRVIKNNSYYIFTKEGKYTTNGECLLFPSKEMRDWNKYLWKKGDVLKTDVEEPCYTIFSSFQDEYAEFSSRYYYCGGEYWLDFGGISSTNKFIKASDDEAKEFIKKIEEHYGGTLNLETLEIEKTKPEFKDGDILTLEDGTIFINKCIDYAEPYCYASLYKNNLVLDFKPCSGDSGLFNNARLSTDSEKQKLFERLAKENKAWDADKKMIINLPKEHEFKPFEKVLVRDGDYDTWRINFFGCLEDTSFYKYVCLKNNWSQCIPYEGNEHLLNTANNPTE